MRSVRDIYAIVDLGAPVEGSPGGNIGFAVVGHNARPTVPAGGPGNLLRQVFPPGGLVQYSPQRVL
jgi:hypothetical protein